MTAAPMYQSLVLIMAFRIIHCTVIVSHVAPGFHLNEKMTTITGMYQMSEEQPA